MFCPKCGTQNPEEGRFCRSCGADLGNVPAALSGNLQPAPAPMAPMFDHKGKPINLESAFKKIFTGIAFLVVSCVLAFTGMGRGWWFWMLIPAFVTLGSGLAQYIHLKSSQRNFQGNVAFNSHPQSNVQNEIPPTEKASSLPPSQTDYIRPPQKSIYDTGEFDVPPAPSVTEGTTRHLEINNEGETMTLPKK